MGEVPRHHDNIDSRTDRFGRTRALIVVAIVSIAAVVTNSTVTLLAVQLQSVGGDVLTVGVNLLAIQASFLAVGVGYVWYRPTVPVSVRLPTQGELRLATAALAAGLGTVTLSFASTDVLLLAIEISPGFTGYAGYSISSVAVLLVGALLSLLVVGPVEEFLFRGVVQGRLRLAFEPVRAIGLAGLVFAFFYLYPILLLEPPAAVIVHTTVYYTVMGVIFGVTYEQAGTLVVPALVHGLFTVTLFLAMVPFA
ncbi:CPBP family intramembrane glutamic endopeptidase [Natronobacterium gregoryi]|uniref:CAAX amino terminal protease family n=2 Tax=Natronobacterium gregoryi TaxID=44930 RepID=L0AE17_NATGS|nr:CPBP family intramembrane glutamic endopeptidase [Natronobacterium gregoryi]AFZ72138.1 CAAX amino terminal protease family [Natronobacterium gregoryi SP2]ELY62832.1 hypothetical protein C490_16753 [Natronobacterium gregoryi SP2]PLK19288.1 CPBP family intramembrane metalloprotease [Natronobacterium gregoryi SP2]SFJ54538.1 hypothetical protein SAMN05443661_1387 [Natronobacterium gregoryi]